LLLAVGTLAAAAPSLGAPVGARIVEAAGQVVVRSPRGADVEAVVGEVLGAGSRLRTGAGGGAVLALEDGSILRLAPDSSTLLQASHSPARRQLLVVSSGRVTLEVRASGRDLVVATPSAVCTVRGTELEVQVADDGAMRVLVRDGTVAVDADTGQGVVEPGQQLEADERSMSLPVAAAGQPPFERWRVVRGERLRTQAGGIVDALAARLATRLGEIDALAAAQRDAASRLDAARVRPLRGDGAVDDEARRLERRLAEITTKLELVGAQVTAELGHAARLQDLAVGPLAPALAPRLREKAAQLQAVRDRVEATLEESGRVLDQRAEAPGVVREPAPEVVPTRSPPVAVPDARALEVDRDAVARLRQAVGRMLRHLEEARDDRDVLELACVDERLAVARGLLDVAEGAEVALVAAVSRHDGEAARHQHEKVAVARARGDRLLAESEACVGERAVYSGETQVELVHDDSSRSHRAAAPAAERPPRPTRDP
jgi:hypothetical protein